MKKKVFKGFTLIELVIAIALVGMFITISGTLINMSFRVHSQTIDEYEINSTVRIASAQVNEIVRYSKAVFALPNDYVEDVDKMDPGWSYFAVSQDKHRVSNYVYDSNLGEHVEQVIVDEKPNIEYELSFVKYNSTQSDNLINFKIVAYVTSVDDEGNTVRTGNKIEYNSKVEALNSLQIVDKGTLLSPSVTLAYRNDSSAQGTGRTQVAKVTFVLDVSGSMDENINGDSKINHLERALIGYTKQNGDVVEGIFNMFAHEKNIEVSVVPFSATANYPSPDETSDTEHPFFNAYDDLATLKTTYSDIPTDGSTNTGDGLRRAYYRHLDFDPVSNGYANDVEEYDYMIVLADGETNRSTWWGNYYREWVWFSYRTYFLPQNEYTGRGGVSLETYTDSVNRVYSVNRNNNSYVQTIGNMIQGQNITTYIIGFGEGLNTFITNLGTYLHSDHVYNYDDEDFDLDEVFENIANDIMAELWLVSGPQIMN
jgi:prepilin-type N-terminal cleavage/methylation domain-containing protein